MIPEQLKRACGILACNIKQMGGVMRWKQRDDYDIKVTLSDEGVFTEEIKVIFRLLLIVFSALFSSRFFEIKLKLFALQNCF